MGGAARSATNSVEIRNISSRREQLGHRTKRAALEILSSTRNHYALALISKGICDFYDTVVKKLCFIYAHYLYIIRE